MSVPINHYKYQQLQQYFFLQRLIFLVLVCKRLEELARQASDTTHSLPTKLQGKDITQENKAENFSYDPVGNRLTGPDSNDAYNYNQGNQLTNDRKHQYEYDKNGNLIKKIETGDDGKSKVWTYSYDYENRLGSVVKQESEKTVTVTFKYDPFGRRLEKKVTTTPSPLAGEGGGEGETKNYTYVYDNEDIILEYLTKTEDGKAKIEATKYVHGPGIDEPLTIERKGEVYFYHADGLGSITALTDKKQKVVESYTYSAFGEVKRKGDKVKNTYTFTAREWDEEIDLFFNRARYRDPETGVFTSYDPVLSPIFKKTHSCATNKITSTVGIPNFEQLKKEPKNFNPYVYAYANPLRYTDSNGLSCTGVPDYPFGFNFEPCCQDHDSCYEGCGRTRIECDRQFYNCMINQCSNEPAVGGRRLICETWARNYYIGVRLGGGNFYSGP